MLSIKIEPAPWPQVPRIQSGYNPHERLWWTSIRLGRRFTSPQLTIRRDFELFWGTCWEKHLKAFYLGFFWVEFLYGSPIVTWCGKRVWG